MLHECTLSDDDRAFMATLPGEDGLDHDIALAVEPERVGRLVQKPVFPFAHVAELLADHAPPIWLIDDMVEAGTLGQVFGASGSGKSFLVIDWAACIATGRAWSDKATAPGAVFYIAGEGFSGFKRRLRAWEIHTGQSLASAPLFFSRQPAALMDAGNAQAVIEAVRQLESTHGKPALIVVDTLHRNMGDGDENNAGDVALFLQSLDAMRGEFGAAVLVVHHSGHAEAGRGRGSSSLRAAVDHEYLLTRHSDGRREMTCTKAKESEPPPAMWFDLEHVDLDWPDGKGGVQSSAVLVASEPGAVDFVQRVKVPAGGNQRIVWDALGEAFIAAGAVTPPGAPDDLPPGRPCIRLADAIAKTRDRLAVDPDRKTERARQAITGLIGRGLLTLHGDFLWCP